MNRPNIPQKNFELPERKSSNPKTQIPPMKSKLLFPVILLLSLVFCLPAMAVVDRINVTSSPYNAIPNDGIDDTAAINAAVAAGRSIYFPPGTYNYTGSITLPANLSYRIYGDGPGVSTIIFAGNPYAGIYGPNIGIHELNVEGLTLKANTANAGTGIYAIFGPNYPNGSAKVRTAAIHNVQIVGSTRDGTTGGYWGGGIYLWKAQNAVVDKVEINGNKNVTSFGFFWDSSTDEAATGLNASNLQIKWCNSAFKTGGHVEGIYLNGFEFTSCGRAGLTAVDLYTSGGGAAVQLVNGRIDSVGSGLAVTNQFAIKLANINFQHTGPEAVDATMVYINNSINNMFDVMITECSFYGVSPGQVANENGIFLNNAHSVRIAGNNFTHMQPGNGSCIVVLSNNTLIRVTDNLFSDVRNRYIDYAPGQVYYQGNN
jgi:hypothetical protein